MSDISVVICTYIEERWNDLVTAVESIQRQSIPPHETILVIDHNRRLFERARTDIPGVIVIESSEPRGLSGARNSGIAVAQGALIAFLDDDAIAEPDWLMLLCEGFADPQVLGVGGAITPLWKDHKPSWFPEEFYWVIGCTYRGTPETVAPIRNLIGANMAIRRETFDSVGGFRTEIGRIGTWPVGCEETELCIRAGQQWPHKVFLYAPQARIHHKIPPHRTHWHYFYARCFAEGLSKAAITRYVGIKNSLASEYIYTFNTLPQGIVRGLADALFHRDLSGFVRAGAIVVGLMVTTAGYLVGNISSQIGALRKADKITVHRPRTPKTLSALEAQRQGSEADLRKVMDRA